MPALFEVALEVALARICWSSRREGQVVQESHRELLVVLLVLLLFAVLGVLCLRATSAKWMLKDNYFEVV